MNIISIDIDILFKDCLYYQQFIDDDLTPLQSWKVIEWKTGKQNYDIDYNCLNFIKDLLKNKCKGAEHYLIQEHDEILNIIEYYGKNNFMTNIDFHHDITYGNGDEELNIENWVQFARTKGYIHKYLWICQDNSEVCQISPFNYTRSSWKDINIDSLPNYDVVVFCISHQFTPPCHWHYAQTLREYLANEVNNEFCLCKEPIFDENLYPNYIGKDSECQVEKSAWYKYFDYYVNGELINGTVWLSIINLGDNKKNILTPSQKLISDILKFYDVGFTWDKGYKSEHYIRRLTKCHNIKNEYSNDISNNIILKMED